MKTFPASGDRIDESEDKRGYRRPLKDSRLHDSCSLRGMIQFKIETLISAVFCLVVMPAILMLAPVEQWFRNNTIFLISLVIFMYAIHFIYMWAKIPDMIRRHKYLKLVCILGAVLFATYLFTYFPFEYGNVVDNKEIIYRNYLRTRIIWFFFIIVSSFSLIIQLTSELFRQTMQKKEIESQNRAAELALYKAQINPHFLFNTMNSLYSMIITKSEKTEDAFIKFSDILKYMYSHAEKDTITIGEEINYLHEYIDLQSLRLNGHTIVSMEEEVEDREIQIPSMLLITFVENAFKYGTSSSKDSKIEIKVREADGTFFFSTRNNIMKRTEGAGIGIENCQRRLRALYHDDFSLTAKDEDGEFYVELTIRLK